MDKIKNLASSLIEKHWDEIDKKNCEIIESKAEVLDTIAKDSAYATWIITECMWWGCNKKGSFEPNYTKEYIVKRDDCDFNVYKIDGSYFKYDSKTQTLIEIEQEKTDKDKFTDNQLAVKVVEQILFDIKDRSGLEDSWERIDNETQLEIEKTWIEIVQRALEYKNSIPI